MERLHPTVHVVDADARSRAEQANAIYALGYHAEVYADITELADFMPGQGIVLVRDDPGASHAAEVIGAMTAHGLWLPVIVTGSEPRVRAVVAAIKAGALDYLRLPLDPERLADTLDRVHDEAREQAEARRRLIEARQLIGTLSAREREVLDWLVEGSSNKAIARELSISPRTVEIHRANMMGKLGARHPADAVRLRLAASGKS
jgi:FixJ family two-component response regulator